MGKEVEAQAPPLFSRFILWEILAIVGFLHVLQYAPANESTPLFFLGNAVVFAALYPIIYFYNQLKLPPFMKFLISPLEYALRALMMASCFVWITYGLYASGFSLGTASCFYVFRDYWMFIAPFFVLDYFILVEHLWGLSKVNFTFWSSVGTLSDAVSGTMGGYLLGKTLNTKWGMFFGGPEVQGLLWIIFILIGVSVVVWFGNKTRKG